MSTRADITVADGFFRAEDKNFIFTINQIDGVTPMNIAGWTMQFRVSSTELGGPATIVKTAALTTPALGICTVTLDSADTFAIDEDVVYWYDLRRVDVGARAELAYGLFNILETYTDS